MRKRGAAVIVTMAVLAGSGPSVTANAAEEPLYKVVATELDAPRGMSVGSDGALYVAEGGEGGDQCNADRSACFGLAGAITQVDAKGSQRRVLTGLPSLLAETPEGPEVVGPTDVSVGGGRGYHMAASDGGVFALGDAVFVGSAGGMRLNSPVVDMAVHPSGLGYWLFAGDGGVFNYGLAPFAGSAGAIRLNRPVVDGDGTPSGKGYVLAGDDGGVFTYGDATFHGSTGARRLNQPVVAILLSPTGKGYLLIAADGGVFAFGDATFHGSTGALRLNRPIVGAAATPTGKGYWLVADDGGVFAFGDAAFFGSMGGRRLNQPIVAIAPTSTGKGYWLFAADGGVFAFGDAVFHGSLGGIRLNQPVVGGSASPLVMGFTVGFGGHPDDRNALGDAGKLFAIAGLTTGANAWMPITDLGAFEKAANPDGKPAAEEGVDTNPYAILLERGFAHAVDAGGNSVVRIGLTGLSLGTVLPPITQTLPPSDGGGEYPSDPVPTSIVRGPDGAYYIGQLTGYPFTEGKANVYRWVPGSAPTVFRDGLTQIADIAFAPNGNLYVSELRFTSPGPPAGQVVEITPAGVRRVVIKGLLFPTGLTVGSNTEVFVTNCGVCMDTGTVLSFDPSKAPAGGIVVPPPPPA